jgi:hypothetical protein
VTHHSHLQLVTQSHESALKRYWRLRRGSNVALLGWLHEKPRPGDVTDEIEAAVSALRQLSRLMEPRP